MFSDYLADGAIFKALLPWDQGGRVGAYNPIQMCLSVPDQWLLPPPIVQQRLSDRQKPPQGWQ